ncbi:chemosensory receptor A [Elysia marginata]|uniref:Chemosensory receptor A n=1 Tax=Elysia marginata TaxID=1093978 RepID=A0AAV4HDS0_9GAST|nr:chemosensory receptor A [Elysia marginata]
MEVSNLTEIFQSNFSLSPKQTSVFPYLKEFLLATKILSPFWVAVILFGLIANVINIVVFLRAGAKDNVTVLLLSLAVSDLVFLVLITPSMCRFVIFTLAARSYQLPFDPAILAFLFYWPAFTSYDLSSFISVSLGVMRCACVAMPLKFKFVFTKSRTIKWVVFLVILAVALRLPVLTINRLAVRLDPTTNASVLFLKQVNRASMSRINDIINRGFVIYVNYITMVTCVCVLTFKLYQAAKIRRSCTSQLPQSSEKLSNKPDDQRLSSKDLQVVKSVVLVCTIFILSQLTFLVTSTIRLIDPEFDAGANLDFLFGIFSQVSRTCSYLNSSINIFVYYNYNTQFRSVFRSLLCVKCKT